MNTQAQAQQSAKRRRVGRKKDKLQMPDSLGCSAENKPDSSQTPQNNGDNHGDCDSDDDRVYVLIFSARTDERGQRVVHSAGAIPYTNVFAVHHAMKPKEDLTAVLPQPTNKAIKDITAIVSDGKLINRNEDEDEDDRASAGTRAGGFYERQFAVPKDQLCGSQLDGPPSDQQMLMNNPHVREWDKWRKIRASKAKETTEMPVTKRLKRTRED